MASNSVDYIIRLLPDASELKKKLKTGDVLNFSDISNIKNLIIDEVKKATSAINKEAPKMHNAIQQGLDVDTSQLEKQLQFIAGLMSELEKLPNPMEDWTKRGKGVYDTFVNLQNSVSALSSDVKSLQGSLSALNSSFETFKNSYQSFRPTEFAGIAKDAKNVITTVAKMNDSLSAFSGTMEEKVVKVKRLKTALQELTKTNYKLTINDDQLESEFRKAEEKVDRLWDKADKTGKSYDIAINKQYAKMYAIEKRRAQLKLPSFIEEDYSGTDDYRKQAMQDWAKSVEQTADRVLKSIAKLEEDINNTLGKSFAKVISEQVSEIKLSLTLPDEKQFIADINNYIDKINSKSDTFHTIGLTTGVIDDALNPIEDKKKRAQKSKKHENPAQDDVVTDSLVKKTDSRFERVEKVITKRQDSILKGTQKWRKDMIEAMSLSSKDLTFDFKGVNPGEELYKEIEQYFNENPINVQVDTKSIAEQIKSIIEAEGLTIGSGGGVANVDPRAIASAVYAAINSAFTGEKIPEYEYRDSGNRADGDELEDVPVDDSIEDAVESSKKYVKTLDETTININKTVESLKEFAKVATATKKDKDGKIVPAASQGVIKIRDWLTDFKGIDIAKIASGEVDDVGIRQMLQDALLTETEDGYASGSAFVDRLRELIEKYKVNVESGSGKSVGELKFQIKELLDMLEIKQETVLDQEKRYNAVEIAKTAIGAGQSLNLLNIVRGKLNPKKKLKNLPTIDEIQKVIDDFTLKGINTDDLESLKVARETLGDKTDDASMDAFREAAKEFYEKSRGIFDTLNLQFGDFEGTIKVRGRKNTNDISELSDVYSIPKDAVIVDAKVYKYTESKAIDKSIVGSSAMRESNWRKARRQEQRWLYEGSRSFGKAGYLSEKPVEFGRSKKPDILDKPINVIPFEPKKDKSSSQQPIDLDNEVSKAQETIRNTEAKIQENESKLQELDAKIVEQKALIEHEKQTLNAISEEKNIIDQKQIRSMSGTISLRQNVVKDIQNAIESKKALPDISNTSDILLVYPEIAEKIKNINNAVKEREELEEQLNLIERTTVEEAQKRLDTFKTDEKRAKELREKPELTKEQRERLNELEDLINLRESSKKLYQDYLNNQDATKSTLRTNIESLGNQIGNERSVLLEWAKAEAKRIPDATVELEKAAKPIISKFRVYLRSLYDEAISVEAKLGDENLSDEERNTLIGHLQNVLRFIQETETEYKNFAKNVNGSEYLLGKDKRNKISSLIDTYVTNTPSIINERKKKVDSAELGLERINKEKKRAEDEITQAKNDKKSKEQLILRIQKQKEFNSLKEKEVALQAEINKLESDSSNAEEKKKELLDITNELSKVRDELDNIGGSIKGNEYKGLSEKEIKEYALEKAKQYQTDIINLTAQKYAAKTRSDRIDDRISDIKKYKLGAGEGRTALFKTKGKLTKAFISSDYFRAQEQALRDKTKTAIIEAENESRKIFDQKVIEAMRRGGMNPDSQEETQKFLGTKRGQQLSADFASEVDTKEKNIWAQYEVDKKDLRAKLLKDFTDSFSIDKKGVLSATFKTQDENGQWIDDVKYETILQDLLAKLDAEKKDLKKKYKVEEMDSKIADARKQQQLAMNYGGLSQSDILNDDIVQQQIKYRQDIINAQDKLAKEQEKLNALKEAGIDDNNEEVKAQNKVISQINEEIARNQVLIDNRDKLIELRQKEKENSELSAEEKRILATERLQKAKDDLAKTDEKIINLQKEYDAAKGTEKEMVALKALNDEKEKQERFKGKISREEKIVGYWSKKVNTEPEKVKDIDGSSTTTGSGGILGAIKSAVKEALTGVSTNVEVDTSHLATEETLQAIYELLGGGEPIISDNTTSSDVGVSRNIKKPTYIHYGGRSNVFDKNRVKSIISHPYIPTKPMQGFWGSNADSANGWEAFINSLSEPERSLKIDEARQNALTFELSDEARVLTIDASSIDEVVKKYATEGSVLPNSATREMFNRLGMPARFQGGFNWEKIAQDYDAIDFIASGPNGVGKLIPGWDCDSIVINNPNVVENIKSLSSDEINNRLSAYLNDGGLGRNTKKEEPQKISQQIMSEGMEARIARANALSQAGLPVSRARLLLNGDDAFEKMLGGDKIKDVIDSTVWPKMLQQLDDAGFDSWEQFNEKLSSIADNSVWKSKKASSWIHFATPDSKFDGPITKKAYGSFADIGQLSSELINKILNELTVKGFKGQIKIPSDITGFYDTDQIVGHAVDDNSFRILVDTLQKFANSGVLSSVATGVDTNTKVLRAKKGASFTQLIGEIYEAAPGQTFTVQEIKSIINSIVKNQSGKFDQELVKPIVDNLISQRVSVPVEPEIAPGAVDKEVKENVNKAPAEAPVTPTIEKTEYQKAVETVRGAIGDFSLRTSNANKVEKYNSLGQEVKDAANVLRTTKEGVIKEGSDLLNKMYKLREAANEVAGHQIQSSTEEYNTAYDNMSQMISKYVELGILSEDDQKEFLRLLPQMLADETKQVSDEDEKIWNKLKSKLSVLYEEPTDDKSDLPARKAEIESKPTGSSGGGIVGIMRTELAKDSTLQKVLSTLGEIAKKNAMSGKPNSAQDLLEQFRRMLESDAWEGRERVAYMDLATGSMSNAITGNNEGVSAERLKILREAYAGKMDMNAQVHTHANEDDPYFSSKDLKQFGIEFANGITKQILLSKNNMTVLDMADVKDVNGLLDALAKTEQNFEALATTADKFGAKYTNKAFDALTPQGLVKMLGIKGIESKLNQEETRESARTGVVAEEAKEAANIIQESTGRAVKTTVERVGLELETLTEKTDTKGNKTWSSQINNKTLKAMQATNKQITGLNLNNVFGVGTDAQIALVDYSDKYTKLLDLAQQFNSASKEDRVGLQAQINELLPLFNEAEKKLVSLIARKDKFMGDKEAIKIFEGADLANAGDSLKSLATERYAKNGLNPGDNIAFNGVSETQNGTRLLVDILKNGTIQQYALEVDRATGQVKEFMTAEAALANAFQNVNKAMRQNKYVLADIAIGDTPEEQDTWMANASAPQLDAYKKVFEEMQSYTAQLWNSKEAPTQQQLDYLMQLSERVIILGKDIQKTSGIFKNFWAQNPDNVFGFNIDFQPYDRDEKIRAAMEEYAKINANANNSEYNFSSFDNDTLQYTLTDVEGRISKVTLQWNELYKQIAVVSNKSTDALDPMVAKINKYDESIQQAVKDGYLMSNDSNIDSFNKIKDSIKWLVEGIQNGTETFETAGDKLKELRQEALKYGEAANKLSNKNKRLYVGTNEINSASRQRDKIIGITGVGLESEDQPSLFKKYISAYDALIAKHQEYADQNKLNDPKIQEQLRQQAAGVQKIGRQFLAAAGEAEKLQGYVDQSGGLGGVKQVSAEETKNMETTMRAYASAVLGADLETVKFDSTTQTMTGVFRQNNKTVSDMVVKYNKATEALYLYQKQERESLSGFPALMHGIKEKMKAIMQYVASITSIYRVWGMLRQGVQYVKEIDSALTELKKVTDETEESYDKFLNTAAKTADKVGSTIKEVVSSTADWARLGYSLEDAANLAESTSVLLNVSEFQSIDDATSALVSTMQAFGYAAKDSMHVVDVMNEIGNNYAISSDGIATALQDSASSLMAANNSYQEAVSLIAAANKVVQDPNSVGAALRTISLRLRGTSVSDLENAGEDTTGAVTSKSKLRSKIKSLSGVDILTDTGAYKSTYEILLEISKVWKDMSDIDQAALLEIIAGKTRSNTAAAILSNTTDLENAYVDALNAEGKLHCLSIQKCI